MSELVYAMCLVDKCCSESTMRTAVCMYVCMYDYIAVSTVHAACVSRELIVALDPIEPSSTHLPSISARHTLNCVLCHACSKKAAGQIVVLSAV